jgi:hypothetical protein
MKRVLATAMAVALILAAEAWAIAAPAEPDATVEFSGGSSATGVGYAWAGGTLRYHGKAYPFRLSGLSVVDIDTSIEASGEVYHLAKLADFAGDYRQVDAETALPGSGTASAIENQHGVVIGLDSTLLGLQFEPSLIGVSVELASGSR